MAGNINSLSAIRTVADGTAGPHDYTVTRGYEVVDVIANTNATLGGATLTVQRQPAAGGGFVALSSALATDTVDDVEFTVTLATAQATFAVGDTHRVVVANLANARLFTVVIPTTWVAG